jgi:probable HAF family extracellular repeat protein
MFALAALLYPKAGASQPANGYAIVDLGVASLSARTASLPPYGQNGSRVFATEFTSSTDPDGGYHSYLYNLTKGTKVRLPTLANFCPGLKYETVALAINTKNQVVGWGTSSVNVSALYGCLPHAFVWHSSGGIRDLGTLNPDEMSLAADINAGNDVVGYSGSPGGATNAVLWPAGGHPVDLNTVNVIGGGPWVNLDVARKISNLGVILGNGRLNTANGVEPHWFMLIPQ